MEPPCALARRRDSYLPLSPPELACSTRGRGMVHVWSIRKGISLFPSLYLSLFESQQMQTAQNGQGAVLCNIESEREIDGWDERERERGEYRVGVSEDCSWKKSKKEGQKYYGAVLKIAGLTFNCWFGLKNRKQKVYFRKKFQNILLKALIHFISSWTVICESAYLLMEHFQS